MAVDTYSLCPGGTGKKLKFCCSDLVGELEKIDRMLEGEQHLAALGHIDRLLGQGQNRACLMAIKAMLLRATGQLEPAETHVAAFLKAFPENPVAWAESAILTAMTDAGQAAMPKLQRAIALGSRTMEPRVYMAAGVVADALLEDGDWLAARALWRFQTMAAPEDSHPVERLMRVNRSKDIPLLLKGEPPLVPCPAGAAWKPRFDEAMDLLPLGRWQEAADKLDALTQQVSDAPAVWQDLAILRGWLADDDAAGRAWRKFAALCILLEDAVEALATALMLSPDPLGDATDWLRLDWPVRDAQQLQEALLSEPRITQVPFDAAAMTSEESPPPRLVCILLDRPMPETSDGLSLAAMPQILGQAMLFGRQTDREARLEVEGIARCDLDAVKGLLGGLGGEALGPAPEPQVSGRVSASRQLLTRRWNTPRGTTREQLEAITAEHVRQALLERWPETPLGLLGGRTPRQAAAEPAQRIPLLAATAILEHWSWQTPPRFDFNELRTRLGLPTLGPIEPAPGQIETLPLVRLARVVVEKLSDEDLLGGFHRAAAFRAVDAIQKFGREIVARPSFAGRLERQQAHSMLAQTAERIDDALGHVDEGRREAISAGKSCASWDLMDLSLRFTAAQAAEAMRLVQHIETRHIQETGVAQALHRLLVEVGLLNPDGTPVEFAPPAEEPAAAAPSGPAAEPSRLWTPGGAQTPGGGKIWTPE
jgi:hypothetical protein